MWTEKICLPGMSMDEVELVTSSYILFKNFQNMIERVTLRSGTGESTESVVMVIWTHKRGPLGIGTSPRIWRLWFKSHQVNEMFFITTVSRPSVGRTHPPIHWVLGGPFFGVERPGRGADSSPPSSTKVKNAWSYTSTHPYVIALCLVKRLPTLI
jgi:hypothetical protein